VIPRIELTQHARDVAAELRIEFLWIENAVFSPEKVEQPGDGTVHYLRRVVECDARPLRVIVRIASAPPLVITAFFDRRMKGKVP